ncbi:Ubiquinone biosynthesis O-methyltransferase [compost metagenome]
MTIAAARPVLPPGTILQHMYLKERLGRRPPGTFVEVGVGGGHISRLLLDLGWRGVAYDLSAEAVARAEAVLAPELADGRMALRVGNWLEAAGDAPVDVVISSMVIEHLDEADEARYFARCREALAPGGLAVTIVPASMRHWGVEDDIAGHLRRYTADGLETRLAGLGWRLDHAAGLTYPLSNMLLPVSNALVARAERQKTALSAQERTEASGRRDVLGKTRFPGVARWLLNEATMMPFHLWQKAARRSPNALVLYTEASPTT